MKNERKNRSIKIQTSKSSAFIDGFGFWTNRFGPFEPERTFKTKWEEMGITEAINLSTVRIAFNILDWIDLVVRHLNAEAYPMGFEWSFEWNYVIQKYWILCAKGVSTESERNTWISFFGLTFFYFCLQLKCFDLHSIFNSFVIVLLDTECVHV